MVFNFSDAGSLGKTGIKPKMTDKQFIVEEIKRFKNSKRRSDMWDGFRYYKGEHDILYKKRTAIGEKGDLIEVTNLPNNKIVDNQYKKVVDQKNNYLVGQPVVLRSDDQTFVDAVSPYIQTRKFFKLLKAVCKDSINCGIGWIFFCYDDDGNLTFKRFKPYEIIAEWADAEHTILDAAIRTYQITGYVGNQEKIYEKVEVYDSKGVYYFDFTDGVLKAENPVFQPYFTVTDYDGTETGYAWDRIPLIPFKYNEDEIPLLNMCRGLIDGLDKIQSNWEDQMEEDPRNTIIVLVNYDGENLGEFRRNLATYGAVKVRSDGSGSSGDVKTLQLEVNAENFKSVIAEFRRAIIENCMGFDAKFDQLGGNPNEMNLKSMYSDIDLDANGTETEYQSSFEDLIWFLNCHLANTGVGDFEDVEYEVIFNRDIMVNESNTINDIKNSVGILSTETLVAQHPWVDDVNEEIKRLKKEREDAINQYGDFAMKQDPEEDPEEE